MKEHRKARRSTRFITILFIIFLIADYFLFKHRQESSETLIIFIAWLAFTLLLLYGIIYNLIKNLKLKKTVNLKEQGLFIPTNTKVIRFDFEAISGSGKGYYHIVSSNGQTEFSSESIKGKIMGFDIMKLMPLYDIGFKYNLLEIEKTIEELDTLQTANDIENYIETNSSPFFNLFGKGVQKISKGMYYDEMLSRINESKVYLKEISKSPEFKNSYLQHNSYQIHIGDIINVYFDPNDPNIYQVDTDFLYN